MNRREFFQAGKLATLNVPLSGRARANARSREMQADLVIVGAGTGGLAAASRRFVTD